jgi:hypothetical protein
MGGGQYQTMDGEGSLPWNWRSRSSSNPADRESQESSQATTTEAGKASPSQETADLACLTAVVPRPQQAPPSRPAKSKPIDIPKKRTTPPPVFEVAQDKRYWYQ